MRDILKLVAFGCAILTFFMGILHIMLSVGLPIGEYVLGGKNKIIPKGKRYINVILAFVFFLFGSFLYWKSSTHSLSISRRNIKNYNDFILTVFGICSNWKYFFYKKQKRKNSNDSSFFYRVYMQFFYSFVELVTK